MSNADVLKSLKPGDIVKVTRTLRIRSTPSGGRFELWGGDLADAERFYLLDDSPTLKIEMVKKVAKQRTDYKVGDVVSGDELRATMWKRGTIIAIPFISNTTGQYILTAAGRWAHFEDTLKGLPDPAQFPFGAFTMRYVIKYLPD